MLEPLVKVGIIRGDELRIDFLGTYFSKNFDAEFSGRITFTFENGLITVTSRESKVSTTRTVDFEPVAIEHDSFIVHGVEIGRDFHWQQKKNLRYLGSLSVIVENNTLTLINILPIETYLISVVSSEMSSNASEEFLKCSAVVSRSWLLAQLHSAAAEETDQPEEQEKNKAIRWYNREDHRNYDVCSDDHCQRYQGFNPSIGSNVYSAVRQTRGLVLMSNGDICDTRFSKCCGGITEAYENVWENREVPYLAGIVDNRYSDEGYDIDFSDEISASKWILDKPPAFCNTERLDVLSKILLDYDFRTKDFFRWSVEYTQSELAQIIKKKSGIDFGKILDLVPLKRGKSSRLIELKIVGTKKEYTFGKELEIRKMLSESHLYSSAIIIEKLDKKDRVPQRFIIRGAGWGHGVGMCQIGAACMAERGHQFDEILGHYFQNAQLTKYY